MTLKVVWKFSNYPVVLVLNMMSKWRYYRMTEELLKIVEKQQLQIDALEYLSVNPVLESHRDTLIKVWEKVSQPHKWEE
jgi:hypothetical protein